MMEFYDYDYVSQCHQKKVYYVSYGIPGTHRKRKQNSATAKYITLHILYARMFTGYRVEWHNFATP